MQHGHYTHFVHASAGSVDASLAFDASGEVRCTVRWRVMSDIVFHYGLYGTHSPLSDAYGLLRIQRVEDLKDGADIPIELLDAELILEYIHVTLSPHWQHDQDAIWMSARWNEHFDLILLVSDFVTEVFEGMKYILAEGLVDDTYPPETRERITPDLISQFQNLFFLDKMKFVKSEGVSTPPRVDGV
jgi:hypothetical protein